MINNFLIISCIGNNDKLALRINKDFFIHKVERKKNEDKQLILEKDAKILTLEQRVSSDVAYQVDTVGTIDAKIKAATKAQSIGSKIYDNLPGRATGSGIAMMFIGAGMIIGGVLSLTGSADLPEKIGPYSLDEIEKEFFTAIDQRNTLLSQESLACL